jgi:hypothetical protein
VSFFALLHLLELDALLPQYAQNCCQHCWKISPQKKKLLVAQAHQTLIAQSNPVSLVQA